MVLFLFLAVNFLHTIKLRIEEMKHKYYSRNMYNRFFIEFYTDYIPFTKCTLTKPHFLTFKVSQFCAIKRFSHALGNHFKKHSRKWNHKLIDMSDALYSIKNLISHNVHFKFQVRILVFVQSLMVTFISSTSVFLMAIFSIINLKKSYY